MMNDFFSPFCFSRLQKVGKFSCYKHCVVVILVFCILLEEAAIARNTKHRRSSRLNHESEDLLDESADEVFVQKGEGDLIGLIEERLGSNLHEYNDNYVLKRVIRAPLDDDIDEVEDSDEEDEEDEEEDNEGHSTVSTKHNSTSHVSTRSVPTSTTVAPHEPKSQSQPVGNLSIAGIAPKPANNGNQTTSLNLNMTTTSNGTQPLPNSSPGKVLPHGRPPTGATGKLPPGFPSQGIPGFPSQGIPGFPTPGGIPGKPPQGFPPPHGKPPSGFPPHGKPPSGFPPHGKLPPGGGAQFPGIPPNLLKHISAPKPPPKKGELYLPEDYNNLVIPKLNLGKLIGIDSFSAVPVLVFLNIRSVRDIDETLETLTLDLDLVIEWVDGILFDPISAITATARQPDITLNPIFLKKIWRPDIYIDEIVRVKRTSLMNKPLKLKFNHANGFISYTTRLTVQLSCDMIYFYYPADTHRCEFTFRSYSYFGKDMELSWLGTGVYLQDPYDPNFDLQVESIDRVKLPQTFRKLTNDTYDGLRFTILARRKLSFHMVQTYLPSIFFIVITWLCFLVPARMVEARIGISMTTLLTLTSMFASVRESTPIVSYVKAIDIWMVFCIFFVFLTLLEFATFVWLRARREDAEEKKLETQRKAQERKGNGHKELGLNPSFTRSPSLESVELRKYERVAEFTEKFAFVIFSIVFILFNVVYWSWLLVASNYFDWKVNSTLNADID